MNYISSGDKRWFSGLVACVVSIRDVLGLVEGAKFYPFNPIARDSLKPLKRVDNFTLGVCNGWSNVRPYELIPGRQANLS